MDICKAFGKTMRFYRLMREMSVKQLAQKIGMDRSYLSEIEAGKHNPTIANFKRIADGVQISMSHMIQSVEFLMRDDE